MAIGHSSGTLGLLSRTIHMPAIAWLLAVRGAEGLGMWPCFDIGCVGSADPSWQPFWPDVLIQRSARTIHTTAKLSAKHAWHEGQAHRNLNEYPLCMSTCASVYEFHMYTRIVEVAAALNSD